MSMLLLGALLALASCVKSAGVGAVSGLNPTDGSHTTDTTPEFRWTAVDGAVKYQIQIAGSEADLAGSPPVDDKNVNGTIYTPTTALTNQQLHYWRVRAVDGEEQAGAWSGSSLRVDWGAVSGLSPTDGSSTTDTTPEFRWTAVDGAVKYQIQIAGSAADLAGSPPVDDKNVDGTIYTPTMALTNQQLHYWRVRAVDGEEQAGAWSRSSLRVEWGAVSGLSPTDGSRTTDTTPEFRWTAVDGAVKYQIQIAGSAADLAGSQTVNVNVGTSYTPTTALTNLQTHYWRIRAVDGEEQAGAWSRTQTLTANFDIISGLNPTDGSSTTDNTPEFTDMQATDEIENEDPGKRAELAELYKKRDLLQNQIDIVNKRIKAHKTWAWITIPLGILTTGAGVYFLVSSEEAYKNYQDTSDTMAISEYKGQGALYEPLGYSLGGGGLALTVIGTISALTTPDHQKLKERYKSLINKITRMEEQLQ